jgi:hypothetical protein
MHALRRNLQSGYIHIQYIRWFLKIDRVLCKCECNTIKATFWKMEWLTTIGTKHQQIAHQNKCCKNKLSLFTVITNSTMLLSCFDAMWSLLLIQFNVIFIFYRPSLHQWMSPISSESLSKFHRLRQSTSTFSIQTSLLYFPMLLVGTINWIPLSNAVWSQNLSLWWVYDAILGNLHIVNYSHHEIIY